MGRRGRERRYKVREEEEKTDKRQKGKLGRRE